MGTSPPELVALLSGGPASAREAAWQEFLGSVSPLLMHVCRSFGGGDDATMDRYSLVLEGLRERDFHRLRHFAADRNVRLTTWLVVVARRLCLEHQRARFGRARGDQDRAANPELILRRRLQLGIAAEVEITDLARDEGATALESLEQTEVALALRNAIDALPPGDRLILQLRFESGCTAAEIARTLALPTPFHVYRKLRVLLAGLRQTLRKGGFEGG